MRLLALAIVALIGTASVARPAWSQSATVPVAPAATAAATAHAAIEAMAAGNFAQVTPTFTEAMAKGLPEDRLRATWAAVVASAGAFRSQGKERITEKDGYQVVVIPCQFEKNTLDVQIAIDAAGRIASLGIRPPASAAATAVYATPSYATPDKYTERDVTVGASPWALPGTLTLPVGSGPFPAVVLVHGSGPGDRDESLGPYKPFRDLALGLASNGIAVLRYEKRTRQYGAAMAKLATMTVKEETIDDAVSAVAVLRATPGIDPKRIVVLGHSLGGMLIPRIAAVTPSVAGYVVMAGAARPLEDAIVEQTRYLSELDGTITPDEQKTIDQAEQLRASVRALTGPDGPALAGAPASYWWDLRAYDPPQAAVRVMRPMLVLQGERDYQVTPVEFARWRSALANSATATFHSYPSLNHLFGTGVGPASPVDYNVPGHVAEPVVRDIVQWIAALAPASGK